MTNTDELNDLLENGGTVVDAYESTIGRISQVFLDHTTSEPEWATVKTGIFGGAESVVPRSGSTVSGREIQVPFEKATVKDAPRIDDRDGHLTPAQEMELYAYYGVEYGNSHGTLPPMSQDNPAPRRGDCDEDSELGYDESGPTTDQAMTRPEGKLHVGTDQVSGSKARLRKYIVTANVTQTIPVSHEEVLIEREPITEATRGGAMAGGEPTEEHVVELSAERGVVDKEVVPVERIRLDTETVTQDQQITEEVRLGAGRHRR